MIPWFQWTTIQLGPVPIQVWGLFVASGMLLSLIILSKRSPRCGFDPNRVLDLALWAIVGGCISARFFHVLFYEPGYYLSYPAEILKVWHGGLSSFGGLFGAAAGAMLFFRFKKEQYAILIVDSLAFAAVFGWMVGRIGCFMIHDHLGVRCSNCFLAIQTPDGPRLEMALIEIVGMIPLAVLFFIARRKPKEGGWFAAVLFVYYGVLRFIIDFFRAADIPGADARYAGLTPAQYFAILLVAVGGYLLTDLRKKQGRIA